MNQPESINKVNIIAIIKPLFCLVILAFLVWIVYKPGLTGGFIFDDYHSLKKLSVFEGEVTWDHSLEYFGSSDTGPLKRPISVFSFLIDANNWPADAYSFKRTNVFLHIINGLLLFLLIRQVLGYKPERRSKKNLIAFFSAGFWLLHPFLVSTTLYIVQRMAMLPLTFMLLGMLMYIWGRFRYNKDPSLINRFILIVAVWGATLFAMLSKENGVLFLPLVTLFEVFIIQKYLQVKPLNRGFKYILLILPLSFLIVAFLMALPGFMGRFDVREFSAMDRQLTQFRALADYLYHIFIPKYFTYGVFTDGFVVSKGWLKPVTTLISFIFIFGLLCFAWIYRSRYIWFSFSIFFFFIAHSIESTIIPLEMYFEHRNYIAALFLGVPITLFFVKLLDKSRIYFVVLVGVLLYLGFLTFLRVNVWSDNFRLHEMTMNKFPESKRAFAMTADFYARSGYTDRTLMVLGQAIDKHDNISLKLNRLQFLCGRKNLAENQYELYFNQLLHSLNTTPFLQDDIAAYTILFRKLLRKQCQTGNDLEYALKLYEALLNNPYKDRDYSKMLHTAYGMYYHMEKGNYDKAKQNIEDLIFTYHRYYDVFEGFEFLIDKGRYDIVNELLESLRDDYQVQFKHKFDFKMFGKRIQEYQQIIDENL